MDGLSQVWTVHPEAAPKQNQQRLEDVVEKMPMKRKRGRPRKLNKATVPAEPPVPECEEEEGEETSVVVSTGETSKFSSTSMSDEECEDFADRVEVVQPMKRKRGRPRKVHNLSAATETFIEEKKSPAAPCGVEEEPVKRKRGRPPKLGSRSRSDDAVTVHQFEGKMQTRSNSEEGSVILEDCAVSETTSPAVVKRKRGRPRKEDIAAAERPHSQTACPLERGEASARASSLRDAMIAKESNDGAEEIADSARKLRRRRSLSSSCEDDQQNEEAVAPTAAAPPQVGEVDAAEECQRLMLKPPYDFFTIPQPPLDDDEFEAACEVSEVNSRSEWIALLPEMMSICNEASRRSTLAKDSKARFFDKPLAADYMYDRVALASEEPRGFVCRERFGERRMQGFIMVGTFASWDMTLRWSSLDPRAWGVVDYDPHRTARSGTSWGRRRRSSAAGGAAADSSGASSAYPRKNPTQQKDTLDRKIVAYMEAADAAFQVANRLAAEERRDQNGFVSDELESTRRQVSQNDDRFTEWPDLLEISLLGALGCGRRLVERVVAAERRNYRFVVLQATEAAVHFYEKRGFVRVGALAKYRDRRDMPELAYRHWNDRITVGSQAHGASHMMAMKLKKGGDAGSASPPPKRRGVAMTARENVEAVARAAILTNTNVIGGSGVFRELVVIAQGLAGKFGANDLELSRALAEALVVFKSNSCGTSKLILKRDVLGLDEDEITPLKKGPYASGRKRNTRGIRLTFDDDDDEKSEEGAGPSPVFVKLSIVVCGLRAKPPVLRAVAQLEGFRRKKVIRVKLVGSSTSLAAAVSPDSLVLKRISTKEGEEGREPTENDDEEEAQERYPPLSVGESVMFRFDPPALWSKVVLTRRPRKKESLVDDRYDDGRHVNRDNLWVCRCEDDTDLLITLNPEERGRDEERHRWYFLSPPPQDLEADEGARETTAH